jgi:hypothetical protein
MLFSTDSQNKSKLSNKGSLTKIALRTAENNGRLAALNEFLRAENTKLKSELIAIKEKYVDLKNKFKKTFLRNPDDASITAASSSINESDVLAWKQPKILTGIPIPEEYEFQPLATCGGNRKLVRVSLQMVSSPEYLQLKQRLADLKDFAIKHCHICDINRIPESVTTYLKPELKENVPLSEEMYWDGYCLNNQPHGKGIFRDKQGKKREDVFIFNGRRIGKGTTITASETDPEVEIKIETHYDHEGNRHGPYKMIDKLKQTQLFYQEGVFKHDVWSGPYYEKAHEQYSKFGFRSETNKLYTVEIDINKSMVKYTEDDGQKTDEILFTRASSTNLVP